LTLTSAALLLAAGVAAGALNAVVGGGGLLTFPVLLALGLPPVTANVTNTVGVLAGSLTSAWTYRPELTGQRAALRVPMFVIAVCSAIGAALLLSLPASTFVAVVPVLLVVACALILLQGAISRAMVAWEATARHRRVILLFGLAVAGVYGGYFGVAVGVLLMALLSLFLSESLQTAGAAKNVLAAVTNGVAAVIFLFAGSINWVPALVLSAGTVAGGRVGVHIGRRLSPTPYRIALVAIGLAAAIRVATRT
jgi:hypothetical protein